MSLLDRLLGSPAFYNTWSFFHFGPRLEQLKARMATIPNPSVLDLGCGTGLLKKNIPDCEYVGVDNSDSYIAYARERLAGRFLVGDITRIGETLGEDDRFDFIVLNGVLHHMDDASSLGMLSGLSPFLKAGGKIIVIDHLNDGLNWMNRILVRLDRGDFIRSEAEFDAMWGRRFLKERLETFSIHLGPFVFWRLACIVLSPSFEKDGA